MRDTITVSVCLVTYNHEEYIREALDSILNQDVNFKYEIVVGDDCSSDKTPQILLEYKEKYPNILKLILRDSNVGVRDNINDVLINCIGKYIAHLDGDDRMLPGKLQKQVDFLESNLDCTICCHNVRIFDDKSNKTIGYFNERYKKGISTIEDLVRYGTFFAHCSKMFRKEAIGEGVDSNNQYIVDWLFHIENSRFGNIGYIDEILGEYRKHPGGITSFNIHKKKMVFKEQIYTLNKARNYVSEEVIKEGFTKLYYTHAWYYLNNKLYKDYKESINLSYKANKKFLNSSHMYIYFFRNSPKLLLTIKKIKQILRN